MSKGRTIETRTAVSYTHLSNVFMMFTRSLTSWKRITEVMDEKIDITEDRAKDIFIEKGEIDFDHVYFKYSRDAQEYVLSDITLLSLIHI